MREIGTPFSKNEIVDAFKLETELVHTFFSRFEIERFFEGRDGLWSPADNLVHLIKSASPVILALKLPRLALRLRFGTGSQSSRPLIQVRYAYQAIVDEGRAISTPSYEPQITAKTEAERAKILGKWLAKGDQMREGLRGWSEVDLEKFTLPHPLLGKMTVREILFFTLYHNQHHVNDVERMLERPLTEWFETERVI